MDEFNIEPLIADINAVVQFTLRRVRLGDSRLAKSVVIKWDYDKGLTVKFSDYMQFIYYGRRAGSKPPPVSVILEWIKRKGIIPRNITQEELAFAVSASIAKKGIKAKPFLDKLLIECTKLVEKHIFEEIKRYVTENL